MRATSRVFILGAAIVGATLITQHSTANAAGDPITELHVVSSPTGKLIVAVSNNGVVLIDPKAKTSFRAWKSRPNAMRGYAQDYFALQDVDRNGTLDVVVSGKPSFIISGDGSPITAIARGCGQFHLGDFDADKSPDIMCRDGNTLKLLTYDGQKLYEYRIQGLKLGTCNFGDTNGDLKEDTECEIKGKGTYVRIAGDGNELGRAFEGAALSGPEDDNPGYAAKMRDLLTGKERFDLNGDGVNEEWLQLDGKAVVLRSGSKPKALGRFELGTPTSVLVEDVDGDNKVDIVLGGNGKVTFINAEGKKVGEVVADPKKLKRKTDVRVEAINANGLTDSSEAAARSAVEKRIAKLNACYDSNVRRDPYTRVGRMIWALSVSKKGTVSKVERLHSALDDKRVESCISRALKGFKFPTANTADASVTVTLTMGFVDR